MKKIILLLACLVASSAASAAIPLTSGKNTVKMTDCSLFANDVDVVLSANVVGGVQCDDVNNFIAVSVCHTSGLVAERSAVVTTDATGVICTVVAGTEDCVQTVTGSTFPSATTTNGTVTSRFPGNTCSTTNVESYVDSLTQ